ncbi:unnamed protein product [Penicillium salamii]|nr:unnamed protein product [Penicillium salamii]
MFSRWVLPRRLSVSTSHLIRSYQNPPLSAGRYVRHISQDTRMKIDKAVAAAPIVLFMKGTPETPQCGFSRAIISMLGQEGVDPRRFVAYNVLDESGLKEDIKDYSEWPTIPQLYMNGEFIGGHDIVMEMHKTGELRKMLLENENSHTAEK